MRRFALLISSGAFSSGIAFGSFAGWDEARVWILVCTGIAVTLCLVFRRESVLFVVWLGMCAFGGMFLAVHEGEYYRALEEQNNVQGVGVVRGEMSIGALDARLVLSASDCEGHICPKENILFRTSQYETFTDGMRVYFGPCNLKRPEQFDPNFDYPMYLAKEGIGFVATRCPITRIPTRGDWFGAGLHATRVFIASMIGKWIPEPEAGLARGLILGGSDELPETLVRDFRTVGLSHIVAVSGYNISVLAGGLFLVGIGLGWYRKRAVWIALLGTVLFVFLVGAPASAVRAALVALVGFGALLVSRPVPSMSILCFAAALMLMGNPLLLRYDIGFQLSFLATFAILFSAPWRSRFQKFHWFIGYFIEAFLITFSVLLFVTPLTLVYFGTLSPYALFANVIALPLVPITFLLSLLVVLLGWIPGIGALIGWIAYCTLHGLIVIVEIMARFPGANASFSSVRWWMIALWYGNCFLFLLWQRRLLRKSEETEMI